MEITAKRQTFPLTEEELEKITKIIITQERFEYYPIHWTSGSYSESKLTSVAKKRIRFKVKIGVHNESDRWSTTFSYILNRETFKFIHTDEDEDDDEL
jgi:hypothetical protein